MEQQKEFFQIIKEIESLLKANLGNVKLTLEQKKRIERIEKLRDQKRQDISLMDQEKNKFQTLYQHCEEELNKMQTGTPAFDVTETQALRILEDIEQLETEIKDAIEFLAGSERSLEEITLEASGEIKKVSNHSANNAARVSSLLEEFPTTQKEQLSRLFKQSIPRTFMAFIHNKGCSECGIKLSLVDEKSIEEKYEIKFCKGCHRVFIPTHL
ncbi:MAG: hypothetical protein JNM93_01015 [Bacteriovoracaceae bacterium]|nr:hypothetical protein [Bacteriovoracaceae bacterium]